MPESVRWIVVVDDASPDQTSGIVRRAMFDDPRVRLVQHTVNEGVGGAMLTGYREAHRFGADVIAKMDADGQMDPRHLPALIAPILRGEADYTKGNRYIHARALRAMPLLRRIGNVGLSFLTKLASGYWGLFDPANGYTAIRASLIPLLDEAAIARRYFFESSMLLELSLLRAVVRDVYIPARYGNQTSHLSEMETLRTFPAALLKGLCRRVWIQYFVRDFSIGSLYLLAGLGLLAAGTLFGGVHWYRSIRYGTPATTGTVMLAALPVIMGFQFLLQCVGSGHSKPAGGMPEPRHARRGRTIGKRPRVRVGGLLMAIRRAVCRWCGRTCRSLPCPARPNVSVRSIKYAVPGTP